MSLSIPKTGLAASARPMAGQIDVTTAATLALLLLAAWILTHGYFGIVDDGRFYTVQALNALLPGRYANDLYFRYGSQDQFTLFTRIYAPLVAMFGLSPANLILTIAGEALFLGGLAYLADRIFADRRMMFVALAAAILLPGGSQIRYGEPLLTPRLYAEALTLWALGAMLRGQKLRALLIAGVSLTIHPLMTVPGLAVLFAYQASRSRIWWGLAVLAGAGACALGLCGVQPFARLFQSFDPAWYRIVVVRDSLCFVMHWDVNQWQPISNTLALAVLGIAVARGEERRLILTVLAVTCGALIVSFVGADLLRNVLITDAQLWRACWLLAVVENLYVALMLRHFRGRDNLLFLNARFLLLLALGLLVVSNFLPAISITSAPLVGVAAIISGWEQRRDAKMPLAGRIVGMLTVGGILGITLILLRLSIGSMLLTPGGVWRDGWELCLVAAMIACISACIAKPARRAVVCIAILLLLGAAGGWDKRTAWEKFVDDTVTPPKSLTVLLPGDGPLYWEGDIDAPWFLLKTQSYFSCNQGTGVLFSRGTAMAYQQSFNEFQPLQTLDFEPGTACPPMADKTRRPITRAELSAVCDKAAGLGGMVLLEDVADAPKKIWIAPALFRYAIMDDGRYRRYATDRFYIYSCAELR